MATGVGLLVKVSANLDEMRLAMTQAENTVNTTTQALKNASNAYDGTRTVAAANAAVLQIQQLGGVAHLTEQEQAKLNSTLNEGIDKLQALGRAVPTNMQAYADQTARSKQETSSANIALEAMKGTLATLGISLSVESLKAFTEHVISTGAQIQHTSEKLEINAETVQRWKFALEQSGGSVDGLVTSVIFLNKTLGKNEAGTAALLEALGLDFDNLKLMDNEARFRAVTSAIVAVKDPILQDQAALALLGRGAAENLGAYKLGLDQVGSGAVVMSAETVKSLDDAEKSWKKLSGAVVTYTGEFIGWIDRATSATGRYSMQQRIVADSAQFFAPATTAQERWTKALAMTDEELRIGLGLQARANASATEFIGPVQAQKSALDILHSTLTRLDNAYDGLDAGTRASILADKGKGASTAELATAYGVQAAVIDRVIAAQAKGDAEVEKYQADLAGYLEVLARMNALVDGSGMTTGDWAKALITAGASLSDVKAVTSLASGELETYKKDIDAATQASREQAKAEKETADASAKNYAEAARLSGETAAADMKASQDTLAAKLQDNQTWYDDELTKLLHSKGDSESYYAALDALRARKAQKDRDALTQETQAETTARAANTLLWDAYYIDLARLHKHDTMDAELQQVKDGLTQQIAALDRSKPEWEQSYAALVAIAGVKQEQIAKNYHDKAVQPMIDDGVKLLDGALHGWDSFKSALVSVFDEILHSFEEKLVAKLVASWASGLSKMGEDYSTWGGVSWSGSLATASAAIMEGGSTFAVFYALTHLPGSHGPEGPPLATPTPPEGVLPGRDGDFAANLAYAQQLYNTALGNSGGFPTGPWWSAFDDFLYLHSELSGHGQGFATGGIVRPNGLAQSDTVPIWASVGERVLSVADTKAYDSMNGGGYRPGGASVHVTFVVQAFDGPSVQDWLDRSGGDQIATSMVQKFPWALEAAGMTH